jgi:hypothetical protein
MDQKIGLLLAEHSTRLESQRSWVRDHYDPESRHHYDTLEGKLRLLETILEENWIQPLPPPPVMGVRRDPRSAWQATPGKRLCGIYITRADGRMINGWLAFGRISAATLSLIPLCIGFFMIGWTRQKTGLHDLVCRTRVVYGRP